MIVLQCNLEVQSVQYHYSILCANRICDKYSFENEKRGVTSLDRDLSCTNNVGNEKRKLKQAENEMLKKLTKITAFSKSDTGKVNKEQELVEEKIEEEVCSCVEEQHPRTKALFLTFFFNPFMHQL